MGRGSERLEPVLAVLWLPVAGRFAPSQVWLWLASSLAGILAFGPALAGLCPDGIFNELSAAVLGRLVPVLDLSWGYI